MYPDERSSAQRLVSIDVGRGFALACMVVIHFTIYYGNPSAVNTWLYFSLNHILGDWGASSFLMIMGISQVLSGQTHQDVANRFLFTRSLIRGIFIFIVGLVMLLMTWGPDHLWQWDILTLMGFSTIVLFFCRFLSSRVVLLAAALIAVSTPALRGQLDIVPVWNKLLTPVPIISSYFPGLIFDPAGAIAANGSMKRILQGFLFTGEFPVFPWLMYPLIGWGLGQRIITRKIRKDLAWLLPAGAASALCGLLLGYLGSLRAGASIIADYIAPLSFYPDSFSMIIFQAGMSLTFILTLYGLYDLRETHRAKTGMLTGIFTKISRSSLTFYFLHYLLIGWPLALIDLFTGKYRIYNLLDSLPALVCGLAALAVLGLGLTLWDARGGKYKLEWILAALVRRFASSPPAGKTS